LSRGVAGAVLAGALAALASPASAAEPTEHVDQRVNYRLTLPAGWSRAELVDDAEEVSELIAMWTSDKTNQVIAIARIPGPTDGAHAGEADFFANVEGGVKKQFATYTRLSHTKRKFGSGRKAVPGYDLWFRTDRDGKKVVFGARFLFFRGYALSIIVDQPGSRKASAATKKIVESFRPAK
jgi:hypothetical protein